MCVLAKLIWASINILINSNQSKAYIFILMQINFILMKMCLLFFFRKATFRYWVSLLVSLQWILTNDQMAPVGFIPFSVLAGMIPVRSADAESTE